MKVASSIAIEMVNREWREVKVDLGCLLPRRGWRI
jgi:hypothetical protein